MLTVDVSIETPPELVIDPTSRVPVILTFGASIVTAPALLIMTSA